MEYPVPKPEVIDLTNDTDPEDEGLPPYHRVFGEPGAAVERSALELTIDYNLKLSKTLVICLTHGTEENVLTLVEYSNSGRRLRSMELPYTVFNELREVLDPEGDHKWDFLDVRNRNVSSMFEHVGFQFYLEVTYHEIHGLLFTVQEYARNPRETRQVTASLTLVDEERKNFVKARDQLEELDPRITVDLSCRYDHYNQLAYYHCFFCNPWRNDDIDMNE